MSKYRTVGNFTSRLICRPIYMYRFFVESVYIVILVCLTQERLSLRTLFMRRKPGNLLKLFTPPVFRPFTNSNQYTLPENYNIMINVLKVSLQNKINRM